MFIRETPTVNKKTGVSYSKYQLVESYRCEKGPRQRIVMTLTELDLDKSLWPALANAIAQRLSGVTSLFESDPIIARYADLAITKYAIRSEVAAAKETRTTEADLEMVDLSSAKTINSRSIGPELIGNSFYEALSFDKILESAGLSGESLGIAKATIIARLIHPGSDRKTYSYINSNSSLPEICGIDLSKFHKDKVYAIADKLYDAKAVIEPALYRASSDLFRTNTRLFLFDLTNTYFEGSTKGNSLAKHGHSKEKRFDCTLVSLALLVDHRGLPIYSEIHEGNTSEPRTLISVLDALESLSDGSLFGDVVPTIVMDRGIATKANLELLIKRNLNYVVIERANKKSLYRSHFMEMEGFTEIYDAQGSPVLVKKLQVEPQKPQGQVKTQVQGQVQTLEEDTGTDDNSSNGATSKNTGDSSSKGDSSTDTKIIKSDSSTDTDDYIRNGATGNNISDSTDTDTNATSISSSSTSISSSSSNNNTTTVVLCRSLGRSKKESAISSQANERFLVDITSLNTSITKGSISKTTVVSERIGRIKAKYPSIASKYEISLEYHQDHGKIIKKRRFDKVINLTITEKPTKAKDDNLQGAYVIDTSHSELDAGEIWNIYTTLTKVEDAFRSLKSDLGLRPVYHQLASRTAAHLFISVLAYHLLSAIELTLRQNNDKRRWSTIKEQLNSHRRATIVLTSDKGVVYHIRTSGVSEPVHKEIYRLLGVSDPLKRIKTIATHL
ncbi:IS1634 family transposase [Acidithrix sp. C25]|uniref:IS1634 family transposase n=1 Tax=Acidithrix sp. C25 TaxID=1671482 RepID=UPI00191B95C1|nr:IS1634 family transposase [Acidithrix sp. C25]